MAELYDVVAANQRATQVGMALGQAAASSYWHGQEMNLRMQELKSQEAFRRLQEQHLAQTMQYAMEQHDLAVQERADMTKAMARVQAETMPETVLPTQMTTGVSLRSQNGGAIDPYTPEPQLPRVPLDQSLMKNVLPVIAKYRPLETDNFIASTAMLPYRLAEAKRQEALANQAAANGGAGSLTQVTGNFPGAPTLNVYKHPNGTTELVGSTGLETITGADGRTYQRQKDGSLKPLAATPDQQNVGRTRQKILSEALKIDPSQVDENGNITPEGWAAVQKQSQITEATRTNLEKQSAAGAQVFQIGQQLADLLTPENVGLRGAGTRLFENVATQINPDYKISGATDALILGTEYTQALTKAMKTDSNIAEAEREQLASAFKVIDWKKGLPQAKTTLATTLSQWGNLSRSNAEIRGKPVYPQWLTPDEITQQFATGQITKEQALKLRDSNGWLLIKRLRGQ